MGSSLVCCAAAGLLGLGRRWERGTRAGARLCDVLALLEPAAPLVGPLSADVMNTMARAGRVTVPRGPGGGREDGEEEGGAHSGRIRGEGGVQQVRASEILSFQDCPAPSRIGGLLPLTRAKTPYLPTLGAVFLFLNLQEEDAKRTRWK